jgi:hypothetical protein
MQKEPKEMFSAIFEKYDNTSEPSKSKTYFSDVRSREGGVVKKYLVFDEEVSSTIPKPLSLGEYVAFLADLEFKNIQFLNVYELSGVSL